MSEMEGADLFCSILFLQDVMYLMIVNMPSKVDLLTVKREMQQGKKKKAPSEQASGQSKEGRERGGGRGAL